MIDTQLITVFSELGFKPVELLVLAMLWQNVKNTKSLLDQLVQRVIELERNVSAKI